MNIARKHRPAKTSSRRTGSLMKKFRDANSSRGTEGINKQVGNNVRMSI